MDCGVKGLVPGGPPAGVGRPGEDGGGVRRLFIVGEGVGFLVEPEVASISLIIKLVDGCETIGKGVGKTGVGEGTEIGSGGGGGGGGTSCTTEFEPVSEAVVTVGEAGGKHAGSVDGATVVFPTGG